MSLKLLTDREITKLAKTGMISPFQHDRVTKGVVSFGRSFFGYDLRLARGVNVMMAPQDWNRYMVIDPKNFRSELFMHNQADWVDIPPNSFALGQSVEYFDIPKDMLCLCLGKSTYARCGIITNFTPFEPGWKGYVTIEITNSTPFPARVYTGEGIGQVLFFQSDEEPESTYEGKYQNQAGITGPSVER